MANKMNNLGEDKLKKKRKYKVALINEKGDISRAITDAKKIVTNEQIFAVVIRGNGSLHTFLLCTRKMK